MLIPFVDREGATHFTCEDCGRSISASYEAKTCVCLSCQWLRDHPLAPVPTGFGFINSALEAGRTAARPCDVIKMEGESEVLELYGPWFSEEACTGHVASKSDPKICGRCGVHIDSLRPPEEDEP